MAFFVPLVLLSQPTQVYGGAQLPGAGLLAVGNSEGLLEAGFGLGGIRDGLAQQQGALEASGNPCAVARVSKGHVAGGHGTRAGRPLSSPSDDMVSVTCVDEKPSFVASFSANSSRISRQVIPATVPARASSRQR